MLWLALGCFPSKALKRPKLTSHSAANPLVKTSIALPLWIYQQNNGDALENIPSKHINAITLVLNNSIPWATSALSMLCTMTTNPAKTGSRTSQ